MDEYHDVRGDQFIRDPWIEVRYRGDGSIVLLHYTTGVPKGERTGGGCYVIEMVSMSTNKENPCPISPTNAATPS